MIKVASLTALTALAPILTVAAEDSELLPAVVVSATGYQQSLVDAPASITVIGQDEIQQGDHRSVLDVLATVPGVNLSGGSGGSDVSIRGLPVKYTLLLVDGRPQSSRESQPNGGGGLDQGWLPPLRNIERIEVIRGPMSTLYGSNAMGGVVNVITKPVSSDWGGSLRLDTTLAEDERFGATRQAELAVSGPVIRDVLGVQLAARYTEQDEDDVARGSSEQQLTNLQAKVAYQLSDAQQFGLEFAQREQQRAIHLGKSAPASQRNDSETNNDKTTWVLHHDADWGGFSQATFVQRESTYNEGRDIRITNTQLNSSLTVRSEAHVTSLGIDYLDAFLEDTDSNAADATEIRNTQFAVFAEDEWFVLDTLALTTGLRADQSEHFDTHLSPRLYGVWNATDGWTLKAGLATGYRAPELRQLSSDWQQASRGGNIYGNPDLQPETTRTAELSALYEFEHGLLTLTVFDNRFDDKIVREDCPLATCGEAGATHYVNVDQAMTRGVEFSLNHQLTTALTTSLSYSYTYSEQLSGDNKGQPLTQLPLHRLTAGADWRLNNRTELWLAAEVRGEESAATGLSSNTETQAPTHSLVNLGATYQALQNLRLDVGVNNVGDTEFSFDEFGYVDMGRAYWTAVTLSF